jgi:tRNA 2-thiocytidine biosynthesis protein TtcA
MNVERRLGRAMSKAIADFQMLEDGDRVMVCVSGGKDSYTLLHLLRALQKKAPIDFSLHVVNVDQGHPGYPGHILREWMATEAYDFRMVQEDTFSIVTEKIPAGKTFCSLCSRLRRGILYRVAGEIGATKIALGHHRDDVLQTLLLNLLFAGKLATMPPKLVADVLAPPREGETAGRPHQVIRPLVYAAEEDIRVFATEQAFPILPCDLCGSQDNLQRKQVGRMLDDLEEKRPGTKQIMLAALQNVEPSHLLDRSLWSALGLSAAKEAEPQEQQMIPLDRLVRHDRMS